VVYETLISKQMEVLPSPSASPPSAAHAKAPAVPETLRRIFEAALSEHGERAPTLWLKYAMCHLAVADFSMAAAVYARALRALHADLHAGFVNEYQRTTAG